MTTNFLSSHVFEHFPTSYPRRKVSFWTSKIKAGKQTIYPGSDSAAFHYTIRPGASLHRLYLIRVIRYKMLTLRFNQGWEYIQKLCVLIASPTEAKSNFEIGPKHTCNWCQKIGISARTPKNTLLRRVSGGYCQHRRNRCQIFCSQGRIQGRATEATAPGPPQKRGLHNRLRKKKSNSDK